MQNDWSNLVPSLERGDFDVIINGLEDTPALRERILLSRPYFAFSEQLVVRRGAMARSLAELQGHLVRGDDVVATDDALVFHTHRICSSSTAPIRTKAERRSRGGHPNSALKSGMKRSRK